MRLGSAGELRWGLEDLRHRRDGDGYTQDKDSVEDDGIRMMEMSMDMRLNIFLGERERRMGRDVGYKRMG